MHLSLPVFWPWVAIAALFIFLAVIGLPGRAISSLVLRLVLGGAAIVVVDLLVKGQGSFDLGLNPLTAAVVGYMGVPGLLLAWGAHMILTGAL